MVVLSAVLQRTVSRYIPVFKVTLLTAALFLWWMDVTGKVAALLSDMVPRDGSAFPLPSDLGSEEGDGASAGGAGLWDAVDPMEQVRCYVQVCRSQLVALIFVCSLKFCQGEQPMIPLKYIPNEVYFR